MDGFAMLGALTVSEGTNAMAILAPTQLPPGHVSWTSKDIAAADQTFATPQPSTLQALMVTGACLVAWKEATFDSNTAKREEDKDEKETTEPRS